MEETNPNQSSIGSKTSSRNQMEIDLNLPLPCSDFHDSNDSDCVEVIPIYDDACKPNQSSLGSQNASRNEVGIDLNLPPPCSDFHDSNDVVEGVPIYVVSSIPTLMQNYHSFRRSGTPSKFMFYKNGSWIDFSDDVFKILKSSFSKGNSIVEVQIAGACYLFDFFQMLQVDLLTGDVRPISWIDIEGKHFFPRESIGEETHSFPEVINISSKVETETRAIQNYTKREKLPLQNSPDEQTNTCKISYPISMGRREWPDVTILKEGEECYSMVKAIFLSGMISDHDVTITSIRKCLHSSPFALSRLEMYKTQEMMTKADNKGVSNIKLAWHATSAELIPDILSRGFNRPKKLSGSDCYGYGIYLSPQGSAYTSALLSKMDHNGEKHLLMCRVIMGNVEKVQQGANQFYPSSIEFDTGVDDLEKPKWYIVWTSKMNRHILPQFIVSFQSKGYPIGPSRRITTPTTQETSNSTFLKLLFKLKSSLPPSKVQELESFHTMYMAGELTNDFFMRQVKLIIGDDTLFNSS
ncbi:inactive poly [ADP-ribose] polymerase RCD1-like isoform X2 [Macadamia integrifolia]|uniref:inactive poly [ADP-ribose] polymerase RCD1-like isoform X2 n=1 Tax=Macadamia integrifolia TaxID=60698 RepID=UPI001C4F563D|nr:inactive poly [ADP-ribose] polymerase RCD1-like isoform X2 [Macadamia integrifolia]